MASWRLVRELLGGVDVAVEVVDVRDPISTRSVRFERMCGELGVSLVVVLNKADLIPKGVGLGWVRYFKVYEGLDAVLVSARERLGTLRFRGLVKEKVREALGGGGVGVVGVFGVPKVGKSTLINVLKGRHSATTSPYPGTPGYTRRAQLFKVRGGFYVLDTPGIIPVEEGVESIIRMNPIDKIPNPVQTAVELIKKVLQHNPKAFQTTYGIETQNPPEILKELAIKRGWIHKKDREPILHEAAKKIIKDYLDGEIKYYVKPPKQPKTQHP